MCSFFVCGSIVSNKRWCRDLLICYLSSDTYVMTGANDRVVVSTIVSTSTVIVVCPMTCLGGSMSSSCSLLVLIKGQ